MSDGARPVSQSGNSSCLSFPCANADPGSSQLEIMFPDKYLILKNEILITTPGFTGRQ